MYCSFNATCDGSVSGCGIDCLYPWVTHDELDDRIVECFVLHITGLFDEVKEIINEGVVKHSCARYEFLLQGRSRKNSRRSCKDIFCTRQTSYNSLTERDLSFASIGTANWREEPGVGADAAP